MKPEPLRWDWNDSPSYWLNGQYSWREERCCIGDEEVQRLIKYSLQLEQILIENAEQVFDLLADIVNFL